MFASIMLFALLQVLLSKTIPAICTVLVAWLAIKKELVKAKNS